MWRASVRLATGQGCTMIGTDGTTAFGVTADHCVGKIGSKVDIVVNGATLTGKVLYKSGNQKLALIGVVSKEIEHFTPVSDQPRRARGFFTFNETGKVELLHTQERGFFTNDSAVLGQNDPGIGVFQGDKLVGVIAHAHSAGSFSSPTLPTLRKFVADAMEIYPAALIEARELPAEKVAIADQKTISTGSVPIQAIRVLDKESVLVVTAFVWERDLPKDEKPRDGATPASAQLRFEWSKWNVATGRESLRIRKEIPFPAVLAMISPDGSWVGVCSNSNHLFNKRKATDFGVVTIWNASSGQKIATWKTKPVYPFLSQIAISPSGKRIALVAMDWPPGKGLFAGGSSELKFETLESSVQVWRVPEGQLEKALHSQRGGLVQLGGFDRNGSHLSAVAWGLGAVLTEPGKAKVSSLGIVWKTRDWKKVAKTIISPQWGGLLCVPHQLETEVAFLDYGYIGSGQMELWDFRSGRKTRTLALGERPEQLVSLSPDGNYCAFKNSTVGGWFKKSTAEIAVLDMESGLIFARLREPKSVATAFSFTNDGRQIISGSSDGGIRIWKLPSSR